MSSSNSAAPAAEAAGGDAPAMINPHNPDFITKVPWYLGESGPSLKHHKVQKVDHLLSVAETDALIQQKIAKRKETQEDAAASRTKSIFKKGACKNCGATTHKEKDCVERPRSSKKSAWKSGLDIAADDVVLRLEDYGKVSYATKRDKWIGYNAEEYTEVVDRHQRLEEERKQRKKEEKEAKRREEELRQRQKEEERAAKKAEKEASTALAALTASNLKKATAGASGEATAENSDDEEEKTTDSGSDSGSDSDSDYDSDEDDDDEDDSREFKAKDEEARDFQGRVARQGGIGGNEMKTTVRNLRIREDTPKYLRNLDLNSAFYDAKTRSMRANPYPHENPENLAYAGDNFIRHTGDAVKMANAQILCWEMQARGEDVDIFSNPSEAEMLHKQFKEKKQLLEESKKDAIYEKYGAQKTTLDPRLRLGQTESYMEYSKDGRIVKGVGKQAPKTKYEEDVYLNNHTSVWGSYFSRSRMAWGFACCHCLMRNEYCTGKAGIVANDSANNQTIDAQKERKMLEKKPQAERNANSAGFVNRNDVYGESSAVKLDDSKVKAALEKEEEWHRRNRSESGQVMADDRRRGYNSMQTVDVTPEDMEAYRLKRQKQEDPMAAFLNGDDETLLEYEPK